MKLPAVFLDTSIHIARLIHSPRTKERIEGRLKYSPLAFCGHTELGGLNQWIHVWAYKDAAERFRVRDEARAGGAWPPNTRGQFVKQENMFVVPAEFSPLR